MGLLRTVRRVSARVQRDRPTRAPTAAPRVLVVFAIDAEGAEAGGSGGTPGARPALSLHAFAPGGEVWHLFRSSWRTRHRDSLGAHPRLTWFVRFDRHLEAAGGRDLVWRALCRAAGPGLDGWGDEVAWHHHHMAFDPRAGRWRFDTDYRGNRDHERGLAAFVAATGRFPTAFRSGALVEPEELATWVAARIPFDFSLPVGPLRTRRRDDAIRGITVDWRWAPNDWTPVRRGASTLFATARTPRWIDLAFDRARRQRDPVLLALALHDADPLRERLAAWLRRIASAARRTGLGYRFATASEAAQAVLGPSRSEGTTRPDRMEEDARCVSAS